MATDDASERHYAYRGVTILRRGNGQLGTVGNEFKGVRVLWTVVKDGRKGATFATKRQAQDAIDRNLDGRPPLSPMAQEAIARLRADIAGQQREEQK